MKLSMILIIAGHNGGQTLEPERQVQRRQPDLRPGREQGDRQGSQNNTCRSGLFVFSLFLYF